MRLLRAYPQPFVMAAVVVAWELIARLARPPWLPPASAVAAAFWEILRSGQLLLLGSTVRTLLIGLLLVFFFGGLLSILVGVSAVMDEALAPFFAAALSIPTIALVPVFILLWGLSDVTRVATVVSFALLPLVVTWAVAARELPAQLLEMARSFGAGPARRLRSVILPAAAPVLLTGVRIAVVQGLKGVVSAEILIGVIGIGQLLQRATLTFDLARLYALILTLVLLSVISYTLLDALERRTARRTAGE